MRARAVHKLAEEVRIYRQLQLAVRHVEERESLEVLRGAAVVGLTTTGAAKYQSLVRQLGARVPSLSPLH